MLNNGVDLSEVLAELARGNVISDSNLATVLQFLTKKAASALEVERVNVWLFDEKHKKIECIQAFEAQSETYCSGEELAAKDYPLYFAALETLRTISAVNAETDEQTKELRENYLKIHRITTLLDAPIYLQGKVVGVICFEHCGTMREWQPLEKAFAGSVADFVSLALENERRVKIEENLHETEQLFLAVARRMFEGLTLLQVDAQQEECVVLFVNEKGAEMHGYSPQELKGKSASVVKAAASPITFAEQLELVKLNERISFEDIHQRRDGTTFPVEVSMEIVTHNGKPTLIILARDISERKALEAEKFELHTKNSQNERLQSLGLLAGGIAHDFNNLLTAIQGNLQLALRNITPENAAHRHLEKIKTVSQIAADLCQQLQVYAGKSGFPTVALDLSGVAREMLNVVRVSIAEEIILRDETAENLPPIFADELQIRQVLMNLLINAADSLGADEGTITVRTGTVKLSPEELKPTSFDLAAEDFIKQATAQTCIFLEVGDTGAGMSESTRQQIFEPFFTTKKSGRGLGMAVLAGIIRAHHGAIKISSEPGKGTTIRVFFVEKQ